MVEERDSELGLYKSREQEQSSVKAALVRQTNINKTQLLKYQHLGKRIILSRTMIFEL